MNRIFSTICYVLATVVGLFLLVGTFVLRMIVVNDFPNEVFLYYISKVEKVYYSIIPYDLNILVFFLVPFIDLFIILKMLKSTTCKRMYLCVLLFIYTSFFALRLSTLQA